VSTTDKWLQVKFSNYVGTFEEILAFVRNAGASAAIGIAAGFVYVYEYKISHVLKIENEHLRWLLEKSAFLSIISSVLVLVLAGLVLLHKTKGKPGYLLSWITFCFMPASFVFSQFGIVKFTAP